MSRTALFQAGLIQSPEAPERALAGGVSSDIVLIDDGVRPLVVKRALAKLRVRDEWFADVSRNRLERAWLAYAAGVVPGSVPRVLFADAQEGWFAMEYFGEGWRTWKSELLAGIAEVATARRAGETLARLHAASWGDERLRAAFAAEKNFHDLRVAPYFLAAAERVPELRRELQAVADELEQSRIALVHGDYSPKNLLVRPGRLIVLDAEATTFGDPAFDSAFLLTHLFLKALHQAPAADPAPLLSLAEVAGTAYREALGGRGGAAFEPRQVRLQLAMLLARVHGKSPVEYLTPAAQRFVTGFVRVALPRPFGSFADLLAAWRRELASLSSR